MEKVTMERLKCSILVFLQVFILVAVSLWFVSMARTGSAEGRSFGKLTSEKTQKQGSTQVFSDIRGRQS